ncbi:MAG: type III-B CRISPR module-associated protein Cmr5, partial [Candidatus Ratteibacteria bacterium]
MGEKETFITKLEKGRAEFAYRCAEQGKKIISKTKIDEEWYQDDKYKSYVKKLSSMILSNGLGQSLAFVVSKRVKPKKEKEKMLPPGDEKNPKNAYDLIYKQLTEYMKSNHTTRISMPQSETDLVKWVISCNSEDYRY